MRELKETWYQILLELILILMTGVFLLKYETIQDKQTFLILYAIIVLNVVLLRIFGKKKRTEAYTEEE